MVSIVKKKAAFDDGSLPWIAPKKASSHLFNPSFFVTRLMFPGKS